MGMRALSSEEGLALFDAAREIPEASLVPAHVDAAALGARADTLPPLFRGLVRARRAQASNAVAASGLKQRLLSLSEPDRDRALLDVVRGETATVLGLKSATALDAGRPLRELGLDSLMAVELRNRLSAVTGLRLSVTLVFDHPTIQALSRALAVKLCDVPRSGSEAHLPDDAVREAITSIPIEQLRKAGLLDTLLRLADRRTARDGDTPERADASTIEKMTVDELVDLALSTD